MLRKFLLIILFLPVFAFADGSKGEKLLNHLWKDMKEGNVRSIKKYTSPEFQSVHYDGARDRSEELQLIANLHLQSYSLTSIKITEERNVLIITYLAQVQEMINGQPVASTSPRLSAFEKVKGKWKWIAHASLSTPSLRAAE
jgi:hypothetical protein